MNGGSQRHGTGDAGEAVEIGQPHQRATVPAATPNESGGRPGTEEGRSSPGPGSMRAALYTSAHNPTRPAPTNGGHDALRLDAFDPGHRLAGPVVRGPG